jgi:hypothetical protein
MDRKEIRQELINAYYSYIGEYHINNICDEIEIEKSDIDNTRVPEHLDDWFTKYTSKVKKEELHKNILNNVRRVLPRVAVITLILIISMTLVTLNVEAIRIKVYNILFAENDKYSTVRIVEEQPNTDITESGEDYYLPTYIPVGFEIESVKELKNFLIIVYINKVNEQFTFTQAPNGTSFHLDTEGSIKEEVLISSNKGIFIEKGGRNILFWSNEECSFYIASGLDRDSLIIIAESIKKK